jgi:hypothetical protein
MISDTRNLWGRSINRRRTRRWIVVAYWLLTALWVCAILLHMIRHHGSFVNISLVYVLLWMPAFLGGVRAGGAVKPFRGVYWPSAADRGGMISLFHRDTGALQEMELDEREMRLRDRVHFVSYTVARWLTITLFGIYALISTKRPDWLGITGPAFLFVIVMVLWSLPQSIILWNEPDVEAER